jgi:hypothetical protein
VRFSSHALPFVPATKRFIRNTQISSMTILRCDSSEIRFGLCPLQQYKGKPWPRFTPRITPASSESYLPTDHVPLRLARPLRCAGQRRCREPHRCSRWSHFVTFCKIRQRFGRTRSRPQRPGTSEEISETCQLREKPRHRRHKHRQLLRGQHWRWHSRHLLWVLLIRAWRSCLHPLFQTISPLTRGVPSPGWELESPMLEPRPA